MRVRLIFECCRRVGVLSSGLTVEPAGQLFQRGQLQEQDGVKASPLPVASPAAQYEFRDNSSYSHIEVERKRKHKISSCIQQLSACLHLPKNSTKFVGHDSTVQ